MPLYEYQCETCGRFELIQKFSDAALTECPTCGKPVQKLLSSPAIQFKGSGWYITDYARKSGGGSGKSEGAGTKSESKDSGSKSDAPATSTSSGGTKSE